MRKGRDGEWKKNGGKKNNGENSGPLTSLQIDRLTPTDCNAAARAKIRMNGHSGAIFDTFQIGVEFLTLGEQKGLSRCPIFRTNWF